MPLPDVPPGTVPVFDGPKRSAWGTGTASPARVAGAWGSPASQDATTPARAAWGAPVALQASTRLAWAVPADVQRGAALVWGRSLQVDLSTRLAWGRALATGVPLQAPWGRALQVGAALRAPWSTPRLVSAAVRAPWGAKRLRLVSTEIPWGVAGVLNAPNRPLPPDTVPPPVPPGPVHLLFCQPIELSSLDLVFNLDPCAAPAYEPDGTAIEARSVYMNVPTITAVRLPDLTPLPVEAFTLSTDDAAFGWTMQFTGPIALRGLLATATGESPWTVRFVINGLTFEFVVESVGRRRSFGRDDVTVTARSLTALLGDPYMPVTAWLNTSIATAQQLVETALDYTGALLDWQVNDWVVPAGAWSFSGTPLAAAMQVASTIGAVVASSRTEAQLIVMPRYPVLPWEWDAVTPDTTIALAASVSEGEERNDSPAYEGIYVSGQAQGELALVKRTGTAPSLIMPMETDPLLTDLIACRQRGEARLGAAGPKARVTETLPVLVGEGEPGIFNVGKLVEVDDPAGAWRGIIRAVSVSYARPILEQTITIERHL